MDTKSNIVMYGGGDKGLDYFYNLVYKTVIVHQDPITGLLPAFQISGSESHAYIRENVYGITCVWALSMAYHRGQGKDDLARAFQLEKSVVMCMRGLLVSMIGQREKVEKFKASLSKEDCLHAKYCSKTGRPVVGDDEWGHLQIDAISLYLLTLAQMTASGIQIIFTLDEVAFVQNLVFYIECAYITPDYGVWERGAKSNQGILELNASSIGMAKAALDALNGLDLFGAKGSAASVIHILPDEAIKCSAVLQSMLPRESNSKETDAAILAIIGYPAFAVGSKTIIEKTLDTIESKLGGRFGMKRFLRDGYKTLKEDTGRLHYEPWELRVFDNIECEWPLFFCFMAINSMFSNDSDLAGDYIDRLDKLSVPNSGMKHLPELYFVPEHSMKKEVESPGSGERFPGGRIPFMWAESLHIVSRLLHDGLLVPAELDPLNRRLAAIRKPDVVVQVVVLAENNKIQELLASQGVSVQTCEQISPIEVKRAGVLSHLFSFLGRSKKLGLSGRKSHDVGILATSKIYEIQEKLFVFTPQFYDSSANYTDTDTWLAMSTLAYSLDYLSTSWTSIGRPTVTLIMTNNMLDEDDIVPAPVINTLHKLADGYLNGTRVCLGTHESFRATSCHTKLAFLGNIEEGEPDNLDPAVVRYLSGQLGNLKIREGLLGPAEPRKFSGVAAAASQSAGVIIPLSGSIKRTRSICPDYETSQRLAQQMQEVSEMDTYDEVHKTRFMLGRERESRSNSSSSSQTTVGADQTLNQNSRRQILPSESCADYSEQEVDELLDMLQSTGDLEIQGDILQYMVVTYGMTYSLMEGRTVRDLLRELYESACSAKNWGIVRHTSGLLDRKIPNLALSLTDLIVRQKQVTIGLPPHHEVIISQPLGSEELRQLISKASNGDTTASSLTQEILVYLAMFIRTEPTLFHGMLRVRVGLILQVMTSEFARSLGISGEEAADKLLNLSPYETKNLLHHIMSGQEYNIEQHGSRHSIVIQRTTMSKVATGSCGKTSSTNTSQMNQRRMSCFPAAFQSIRQKHLSQLKEGQSSELLGEEGEGILSIQEEEDIEVEREGMWMRRRLLDGSLNRVPPDFYTQMWGLLLKCQGLSVQGSTLSQSLTQEMTSGEMGFYLKCEALLNTIPEPEFRQLVVEAILILILAVEHEVVPYLGGIIMVEDIVITANRLFLEDQRRVDGDATLCCTDHPGACGGSRSICVHFYDSAPSGPYGTMSYLVRATCNQLNSIPDDGEISSCTLM